MFIREYKDEGGDCKCKGRTGSEGFIQEHEGKERHWTGILEKEEKGMHGNIRKENEIDRNRRYILEFEREGWKEMYNDDGERKKTNGRMREMKREARRGRKGEGEGMG